MESDVQNWIDRRGIPIDRVGVKGLRYPITVLDKSKGSQSTIAEINMFVDLSPTFKGTHMSRFIEVLNECGGHFDMRKLSSMANLVRERLNAQTSYLEITFPYFMERVAPVSNSPSIMEYTSRIVIFSHDSKDTDIRVGVKVPVSTVCPCSKEMTQGIAHNQRAIITIEIRMNRFVWIEELIEIAEKSASSQVFPLLKREDEKVVTEKAFQNPVFVEDVVRNVAVELKKDERITWFLVEVESFESIHNHNAYASLEWFR